MDKGIYLDLMGITQWQSRGAVQVEAGTVWSLYSAEGLLKGGMVEGAGMNRSEAEKNQVNELIRAISSSISLQAQLGEPEGKPNFVLAFQPDQAQKQAFSSQTGYYEFPFYVSEMLQNPALKRQLWQVIKGLT